MVSPLANGGHGTSLLIEARADGRPRVFSCRESQRNSEGEDDLDEALSAAESRSGKEHSCRWRGRQFGVEVPCEEKAQCAELVWTKMETVNASEDRRSLTF